jgi:uncharacterized membrane protein
MTVISKKTENSARDLAFDANLRPQEPLLKGELRTQSKFRRVRLVSMETNGDEHPARAPSMQKSFIRQPSGLRRDVFSLNNAIGWILQGGVVSSSAVICVGVILLLAHPANLSKRLLVFPHTLGEVWSGLLTLHAQAFIALGLLLLISTPVIRVAASILAFALEQDRRYMAITTIVLAILLTSFLLGKGAG